MSHTRGKTKRRVVQELTKYAPTNRNTEARNRRNRQVKKANERVEATERRAKKFAEKEAEKKQANQVTQPTSSRKKSTPPPGELVLIPARAVKSNIQLNKENESEVQSNDKIIAIPATHVVQISQVEKEGVDLKLSVSKKLNFISNKPFSLFGNNNANRQNVRLLNKKENVTNYLFHEQSDRFELKNLMKMK